jgi:hypothetical protein
MLGRGGKIAVGILAPPTVLCAVLAGLHVHNEVWRQWSETSAWVNMWAGAIHSEIIFVLAAIALVNFALLLVVGVWWLLTARKPAFPHRGFASWFALLLVSAASYFPSDQQYAAVAVLLFGPGQKSEEFQNAAAGCDSTMLLNALILRGAHINERALCIAAQYDSPHVIPRLLEHGAPIGSMCDRGKATALHTAVVARQYRNAQILVKAGAKAVLPDACGSTPLDVARRQGDDRMLGILTQAGRSATPDAPPRQ